MIRKGEGKRMTGWWRNRKEKWMKGFGFGG